MKSIQWVVLTSLLALAGGCQTAPSPSPLAVFEGGCPSSTEVYAPGTRSQSATVGQLVPACKYQPFGGLFPMAEVSVRDRLEMAQILTKARQAGRIVDIAVCSTESCTWQVAGMTCRETSAVENGLRVEILADSADDNRAMTDLLTTHNRTLYKDGAVKSAWKCIAA